MIISKPLRVGNQSISFAISLNTRVNTIVYHSENGMKKSERRRNEKENWKRTEYNNNAKKKKK